MSNFFLVGTISNRQSRNTFSVAANNFQWNCIDVFKIDEVMSINSKEEVTDNSIDVYSFSTDRKIRFLKSSLSQLLKLSKSKTPLFYNIEWYTIHLLIFSILIRSSPRVIALDLSIPRFFYKFLLFLSYNPIVLRKSFLLNKRQKHVLFPGFITKLTLKEDYIKTRNRPLRSILCGSLGPNTGLREYCELAEQNADIEFHVSGVPHRIKQEVITETIEKHNAQCNIVYHGSLDWESYMNLLETCDFGFSLRSAAYENNYNFPSKILEYITIGLIPISSIVYDEYSDFRIFGVNDLPWLERISRPKREEIVKSNLKVLSNYNEVERFF